MNLTASSSFFLPSSNLIPHHVKVAIIAYIWFDFLTLSEEYFSTISFYICVCYKSFKGRVCEIHDLFDGSEASAQQSNTILLPESLSSSSFPGQILFLLEHLLRFPKFIGDSIRS